MTIAEKSLFKTAVDICFTQMSASKGIKECGEQAIAAIIKEFKQLLNGAMPGKPVIQGICYDSLSYEDKKKALDAVNLIKLKRDEKMKGRTCANGSKKRYYLNILSINILILVYEISLHQSYFRIVLIVQCSHNNNK
jgi:hypothetical protein